MSQTALFDRSGKVTDIARARHAAEEGMQRAADHAEEECPGWGDVALRFVERHARAHQRFTAHELRQSAREWGLVMPPSDKAFGQVFRTAAKQGIIRKAGYAPHPERHASPTVLWESMLYRPEAA